MPPPLAAPEAGEGPAPSLPFDLQTVGVVAVGSVLGTLGMRAIDKLLSSPSPLPSAPLVATRSVAPGREDPASWLPAGLLTAAAPRVALALLAGEPAVVFVQLQYLGHTLYYQPSQRVLLWRSAPGQLGRCTPRWRWPRWPSSYPGSRRNLARRRCPTREAS